MRIQTARAEVRTWEESDAESLAVHANNAKIWLNLRDAFPHPFTIEDAREFIRSARTQKPETRFAIAVGGQAVGGVGPRIQVTPKADAVGQVGLDVLAQMARFPEPVPTIVLSAVGQVTTIVKAMRLGAVDYLMKGGRPDALRVRRPGSPPRR